MSNVVSQLLSICLMGSALLSVPGIAGETAVKPQPTEYPSKPAPTLADVSFGDHPRNVLDFYKHVKDRGQDIWVDTFSNISRYEKERDDARLNVTGTAGNITCTLGGILDPKIYDVPLTIVIDAGKVTSAKAERAGKQLPARIAAGTIQVDAAPAPEAISITWK